MLEILKIFPSYIRDLISEFDLKDLEEIRLRVNKQLILKFTSKEIVINYVLSQEEISKILQIICDNSIYSFQNQICSRIYYNQAEDIEYGITGDVVLEERKSKKHFIHI